MVFNNYLRIRKKTKSNESNESNESSSNYSNYGSCDYSINCNCNCIDNSSDSFDNPSMCNTNILNKHDCLRKVHFDNNLKIHNYDLIEEISLTDKSDNKINRFSKTNKLNGKKIIYENIEPIKKESYCCCLFYYNFK